jgi:hypothetical protein
MKVVILSENGVKGTISRGFLNMRVEFAWACAMDVWMQPISQTAELIDEEIDIAIFILPKKTREYDFIPEYFKNLSPKTKVGVMQEGPIDYYLNYTAQEQFAYLEMLFNLDFRLVHNWADKEYLENLLGVPAKVLWSMYDETQIPEKPFSRKGIMVAGNCSSWYNGTYPLYLIRKHFPDVKISIPKSGRVTSDEEKFLKFMGINVLPWQLWGNFIKELNNYALGINLMETRAAGTFNLNCAALGIPCIGFDDVDTQRNCFTNELHINKATYKNHYSVNVKDLINNLIQYREPHKILSHWIDVKHHPISKSKPLVQELLKEIYES